MALIRCPICGEKYDDTYRDCPFCEEEEALEQGVAIRRNTPNRRGGRRAKQGSNVLTPLLIVIVLILAGALVYLLFGDTIADKLGFKDPEGAQIEETIGDETQGSEQTGEETTDPEQTGDSEQTGETDVPTTTTLDYAAAAALPAGLKLSTTDFSLFNVGENHTITVSGGSGEYQWFSEDPAVATVDASGKVMALARGTIHVVVTDGEKQGTCIVRSQISGTTTTTTTPTTSEETTSTAALQAGDGKVVNGGNGVRVRAEANTSSEILATLANGADVQIVASAGDGWYQITFAGVGGVTTTGYMKGEFLANR